MIWYQGNGLISLCSQKERKYGEKKRKEKEAYRRKPLLLVPHAALLQRRAGDLSNPTDGRLFVAGLGFGMLFDNELTNELRSAVPAQKRGELMVGALCDRLLSLDMADSANGGQEQKLNMS